jgi:FAD/FMN-containing dehydrogenase
VELNELRSRIEGGVMNSADISYESLRRAMVWNQLVPDRYPRIIVEAANENDVVEAVRFAHANRMKIAVRGGGHSWVGFSLRDDSLLIDLGRLNAATIDAEARLAIIQPAIRSRELNRLLAERQLAFPVGHCATVPMSGFLLNGALGWNFNAWGPGCFSIEAAKVVTADGNLVMASEQRNPDLLWAVRGAGPGFFGVVTEYSLRAYPAPRAITTSNYYYPLRCAGELGAWAGEVARRLPKNVELTILISPAPPPISDRCQSANGRACILSGTAFVDSTNEAASTLSILDSCPALRDCLLKEPNLPTPIDVLHDAGATFWPERHRYLADTLWTNSPAKVLATSREHFMRAPSSKSSGGFVFSTGKDRSPFPDGAYSMTGDALILCYAVWERPEDDAANAAWHRAMIAELDQYAVGHYVGESDIVADQRRAERSYSKTNWERLQKLRQKYDPEGLFHGHFGAP